VRIFVYFSIFLLFGCGEDLPVSQTVVTKTEPSDDPTKTEKTVLGSDPLLNFQWYLKNTGDDILSFNQFKIGEDIGWDTSFDSKGSGVNVVVSDGRIQLGHEDISSNSKRELSRNYTDGSFLDGEDPDTGSNSDNHGTFIAGLIGASQSNSIGISGVAPQVSIIGYNYIDSAQSLSITLDNYESSVKSIFNYSYGFSNCEITSVPSAEISQIEQQAGTGQIYITASGNDFSADQSDCGGTEGEIYLGNAIYNEFKNFPEIIVVGASNGEGIPSSYSTPGPNLLVSAPGGDGGAPMLSLDLEGCNEGQATKDSSRRFERGEELINKNCNYVMNNMMGTSFATPLVVGASALFMEHCSNCDFRDLRHALVNTAEHREDVNWNYAHPLGLDLSGLDYNLGFVRNSFGLEFNTDLGFGIVNTKKLLDYVEAGTTELFDKRESVSFNDGQFYQSGSVNLAIPDANKNGVSSTISVNSHNLSIEHVLVKVRVNHSYISDLGIDLVSPAGTKHRLIRVNNEVLLSGDKTLTLGVNGFYGEKSLGNWRLVVFDGQSEDTGSLVSWNIKFMGGKWGHQTSSAPQPVNSLINTNNEMNWTVGATDILRFDVCVKEQAESCLDEDWFSLEKGIRQFNNTLFRKNGVWRSIVSGETYSFYIRVIDSNEQESSTVFTDWVAP